jgi:two-component system NtrC family sensor kinase
MNNQALLAVGFFAATASFMLLVLYLLLYRGFPQRFFRLWIWGWAFVTSLSMLQAYYFSPAAAGGAPARFLMLQFCAAGTLFLGAAVLELTGRGRWLRPLAAAGLAGAILLAARAVWFVESSAAQWATNLVLSAIYVGAGWMLWQQVRRQRGYGYKLLAGAMMLHGLHAVDLAAWPAQAFHVMRLSFEGMLDVAVGVGMAVLVLEAGRARTEDLNEKLRRLTLITAATTQTLKVDEVLDRVLQQLVESLDATHGLVRLLDGRGDEAKLVVRAAFGFSERFLERNRAVPANAPWARKLLEQFQPFVATAEVEDVELRRVMQAEQLSALVLLRLPGKEQTLGILGLGSRETRMFQADEINFLVNVANLLGLTVQNLWLFEQVADAQRQWVYTFDSIGDPILVHDQVYNVLRVNRAVAARLEAQPSALVGRPVRDVLSRNGTPWIHCPYCEGAAGTGDALDPTFGGYLLASNSDFHDPLGRRLGTIHVLKDLTEHREAEEKYRSLFGNVQEGVFISTPDGHFVDFNDAFMLLMGYRKREGLLKAEIAATFYVNPSDRERLKKLLREHGAVKDFEFQMRRADGEVRTLRESSYARRDASGTIKEIFGFVLDVTERQQAELEIRRRNRELMVLNSIASSLSQPLDLDDLLHAALKQVVELFSVDLGAIYLLDEKTLQLRRHAAVGFRSEFSRYFPPTPIAREMMEHFRQAKATVLPAQHLPLPQVFQELQAKERIQVSYLVLLWSKERILGGLAVASRVMRDFSAAELNLLTAVGNQIAAAIERALLYEETRSAYDHLRRTQEQLLQSEKMAAVGQLISGVAHELNNPLTAILGYSQLLSGSEHVTQRGSDFVGKLYKQAQRTHRIVQNLLSFARQHRPQRLPVRLNQVLEDTLALREYDLKLNNIAVHREFENGLPSTVGDPHQLQQVFLNILNNAVDAVLEHGQRREIWVRTHNGDGRLVVEFTDSGAGVVDPLRVFDPFFTTKEVGKGTGLGLSICYGIIKEHGGEITVSNSDAPGCGATFQVSLPLMVVNGTPDESPATPVEMRRYGVVLLVDDEETVLDLEQEILRGKCSKVWTARNGREALDILACESVDVLVTDLKMPGEISGADIYAWVRDHRPALPTRVVFTMSDAHTEPVRGLLQQSGCPWLQKPFNVDDFLRVVQQVLAEAQETLHSEVT